MTHHLHIICFDIPYPANYGGAIDVFYRIRALHDSGVHIILHCYYKGIFHQESALENLCEKVFYYPRCTTFWENLSILPYAVKSRPTQQLLSHLLEDDYPILFEGLVCCQLIDHPALRTRIRLFRECNVEHKYYRALGNVSSSISKKLYFYIEAEKLRHYEHKVRTANAIFALAHQDETHFKRCYPQTTVVYLPCFHAHDNVCIPLGRGQHILYHGNLAVAENENAAQYIIQYIAPMLPHIPFVIAGAHVSRHLQIIAGKQRNVTIINTPSDSQLESLIAAAQIHLLVTFQATGLKLKLLNVLYTGRHVIVNSPMVVGTELGNLCHIGNSREQLVELCLRYFQKPFTNEDVTHRREILNIFNNKSLIKTLIQYIYD